MSTFPIHSTTRHAHFFARGVAYVLGVCSAAVVALFLLEDGNTLGGTLISDQFNHRVIVVNKSKAIVRNFGTLNVPGFGTRNANQGLNGPYDAKVIGDFTGLTPPFPQGE